MFLLFFLVVDDEECDADHHDHKPQAGEKEPSNSKLVLGKRAVGESLVIEEAREDVHNQCRPSRTDKTKDL